MAGRADPTGLSWARLIEVVIWELAYLELGPTRNEFIGFSLSSALACRSG